ncbi:MAG: SDR family NAD(P)-dependent oxidoreductase [Bacteroidia bacterium]|nr:SDR family NAD(P)-dependent oxidoreductase [Bacteroidia bacterium]
MYNPFTLEGKTMLITGASSGIGRSIAIECSKMGGNVIITGRDLARLRQTTNELSGSLNRLIVADLLNQESVYNLAEELPVLDGIVHCAGINKLMPLKFIKDDLFNKVMGTNFNSPALLTSKLHKKKKIAKGASIVFVSSISAFYAALANSVYMASKGAVNAFVKGLALELASSEIRVNSIQPGMIQTSLLENSLLGSEALNDDEARYPLGRYGKPEDVAYTVVYLLSDASKWVTGSILTIDGGVTLR